MRWPGHPRTWPLAVKAPLLVAGLMAAVGSLISYTVLTRLAEEQQAQTRQLAAAHLGSLAVAIEPHLARQDVWETFDVLDHARRAATMASARQLVVVQPDASVVAASDPMGQWTQASSWVLSIANPSDRPSRARNPSGSGVPTG